MAQKHYKDCGFNKYMNKSAKHKDYYEGILQLRDIEQYEFKEISKMLDMNETAIRVSLSRARKTLREQLTKTHSYGVK